MPSRLDDQVMNIAILYAIRNMPLNRKRYFTWLLLPLFIHEYIPFLTQ